MSTTLPAQIFVRKAKTTDDISKMSPIDRAQYFYALQKEFESEAKRYGDIARACYAEAFRNGQTESSDGLFSLIVSNADGIATIPDRDIFFANHPEDAEALYRMQVEAYRPDLTMKALREYVANVKGLKGKDAEEYIRTCSVIVQVDPTFRAKVVEKKEVE